MRWCLQIIIYYGLKVIGYYQNFFLLKISSIQRTPHLKYLKWSRSVVSDSLRPVDCSPPSSSVHGILQARILEWVAISFSRGSSRPRDWTQVSHIAGRRFNLWATREATSQSQTCTKKKVTGGLLLDWSATAIWIPAKPLHLSMLSKSMRCTEISILQGQLFAGKMFP